MTIGVLKVVTINDGKPIPMDWRSGGTFKLEVPEAVCPFFGENFLIEGSDGQIRAVVETWEPFADQWIRITGQRAITEEEWHAKDSDE